MGASLLTLHAKARDRFCKREIRCWSLHIIHSTHPQTSEETQNTLKIPPGKLKKKKCNNIFFSQWMLKRVINHISLSSECILFNFPQTHKHNRRTYSECKSIFRFLLCIKELKISINVFSHKQSTYDLKHIGLKLPLIKWLTNKQSLCQRVHLRTAGNHTTVRHTSEVSHYNRSYPDRNRQQPRMFK